MLRFIFVCMGVVVLSFLSIAFQSVTDGITSAQNDIASRNSVEEQQTVAVIEEPELTAEELNNVVPAAGVEIGPDNFGGAGFRNVAPKALADDAAMPPVAMPQAATDSLN